MTRIIFATVFCAFGLALPSVAQAEIREGVTTDPKDQAQSVDGKNRVDLAGLTVRYETAGTVSVTAKFFDAYENTSGIGGTQLGMWLGTSVTEYSASCGMDGGSISLSGDITSSPGSSAAGSFLFISGYDGYIPATKTRSADGTEITWTVSHPLLANRNFICADSIRLYAPDRDGHCSPSLNNCQQIVYSYVYDTVDPFFFSGFAPPVCGDAKDNDGDGKIDDADPGCLGTKTGASEDDPAPVASRLALKVTKRSPRSCSIKANLTVNSSRPANLLVGTTPLFPLGNAKVELLGLSKGNRRTKMTRRINLSEGSYTSFRVTRSGWYRMRASYLGDRFRATSPVVSKRLRACK